MSVTAEQATIIGAFIAMVGGVLTTLIGARRSAAKTEEVSEKIGERDEGDASVIDLLETLVAGQAGQDWRLATMEHRQNSTEADVSTLQDQMRTLTGQVGDVADRLDDHVRNHPSEAR